MEMQEPELDYEEEDYQSTSNSSETDFFSELLLADSDEKFIEIIMKLKSDNDKFVSVYNSFKDYNEKKRTSSRLKSIQNRLAKLLINLKQNDRYTETESQKAILWFLKRFCINHLLGSTKQIQTAYTQIFSEFTSFQDFLYFIQQVGDIRIIFKKSLFNERLSHLYHEKYDKLQKEDTKMKFAQTMKTLDEERKLIVKAEIIYYFRQYITSWNIETSEIEQILNVLAEKPYEKLFQCILNKQVKAIKNLKTSILKSKIELKDGKSEIVFGSKCGLHKDLKTKEIFELTAKKCDGSDLIPQVDTESLIIHDDYLYTKWSQDIVISAKERVCYGTARQGSLNETFLKLLLFFKKVFENKNKHIQFLGESTKMIEEGSQDTSPKETIDYICHSLQLLVKFLGFNSIDINQREQNLSDLFSSSFLEELFRFFEDQLKSALILEEESKQMKDDKKSKNIILETIDYLVTLALHLFYRRDFQAITVITSKVSQTLLRILLTIPNFPIKWTTLRNYKLVMDRWGEFVEEGSADFKLLIGKFLSSYFNEKVVVASKSSSAVFNPRNANKAYYNIFGSELVKFVESLQKQLDQLDAENSSSKVARAMNFKVSKIILFLCTRARYSELSKIAEHLSKIYKKHAHIVPEIYLFRSWISQFPLPKSNFSEVSEKLIECSKLMMLVSDKIQKLSVQQLLTPVLKLNQEQFSQILKTLNLYKICHSQTMNILQIKPKKQQLGDEVIKGLIDITRKHVEVFYSMYVKGKQFESLDKQAYNLLIEENQLSYRNDNESIFLTIQQTKKNILGLVRFFICNAENLLSTKDYSTIVGELGAWFRDVVISSQNKKDNEKLTFLIRNLNITIGYRLPTGFKCHLMKPQFLAASRALSGQFNLNKTEFTPFNEVMAFYEQIKPVYSKFIKLLVETKMSEKSKTKSQTQFNEACNQIIEYTIFPNTFIGGPCNFNGKLENKSTENMVMGVFLEQAQILAKDFSIEEYLQLNEKYPLMKMLKITQDKQSKISEQKAGRSIHGGLFANVRGDNQGGRLFDGMRADRSTTLFRNELMQYGYTPDQIQIALENIGVPDPQLATQWIENNQQTIENLLIEKAIRQSKEQTTMKQKVETKVQVGKIAPIGYSEFKDKLKESMDSLVKSLWRQLFDHDLQKGKKMTDLVFVIIDVFKAFYKTNQYLNFSKKMFSEIQIMNEQAKKPQYKFDDKKYRLILYVLKFTLKRQTEVFKNYYKDKDGVCLKILGLVPLFGQSSTTQEQKKKEKCEDFKILIEIINKTLPEWKNPPQQVKSELIDYLNCLLDLIKISNLGNKDVWQILYKISLLQLPQLREKIINLFSNIVLSKQILEAERQIFKQENKPIEKEKRNIFYKAPRKTLPQKVYMLPLVKILLEHEKQLLVSNIELEIKGYIVEQHKKQIIEMSQKEETKRLPLEIDLKKFSFAFEKFIGCAEFEKVFRKLFSKKKNKKGTLFYDFTKHPLYISEFADESTQQSFISVKYGALVEQILQTMISRPLQFEEEERQLQQESLITLYKFLDYFKVLIPTALRTKFLSPKTKKPMTLLQWLVCESVALNEKKYHFITFLSMNNHLFVNEKQTISDWVCNEYIIIFRREINAFSQCLRQNKQHEMVENNTDNGFKEESPEELRFKKVMFHFMYLLQVDKFNTQCFLKTVDEKSVRDQIESLFLNVIPVQQPILYILMSEIIFILRKREMIELLKDKYEIHSPEVISEQNQPVNLNRSQFLTMSLIFDFDQPNFGDATYLMKSSRRRNIFSGSSGRIIVDEVDDQDFDDDEGMDWDEMEARAEIDEQALGFPGFRVMRNDQRNLRPGQNGDAFLYPSESYRLASQPISIENQEPQHLSNENQQQKIQEEPIKSKEESKPLSPSEYAEILKKQSDTLVQTLKIIENLLPTLRNLDRTPYSKQKLQEIKEQKMISQDQGRQVEGFTEFVQSLSALDQKVKEKISLISIQNGNFDPNNDISPEFLCRLSFKDNISKLAKFEKRFKSMIIAFCPQVELNIWQNNHGEDQKGTGQKKVRSIPNARQLLQRLERQSNVENRDRMINSIQSILNLGRGDGRQQDNRPRNINLNEAFQSLPEQPEPPKQEQKPKSEQKQPQKPKSQGKVEVKTDQSQVQQKQKQELPIEEKIVEQKPQQKVEQKMEEEKPVESAEQKIEEKPDQNENQMNIEEQKPIQPEPIIPESPLVQQLPVSIQAPQQVMAETGPYREILAMFGLPQTYLADNGIDLQSFDSLPEELQIDQLQHYISQAQNRMAINQLNQANQPVQQNANQQQGENQNGQQGQQNQGRSGVNDVLQENIALFASMDPQTRMQMLADYPPQFLMQLPVQMRTQVQQYRQRQLRRIASQEEEQNFYGLREQIISQGNKKKEKNLKDIKKEDAKYPSPDELKFNPVSDSLAEHLAKSIFLKIEKTPMIDGFRFLLQHYLTQDAALATIIGILNCEDGVKTIELQRKPEENKKNSQKSESSIVITKKDYWKFESMLLTDAIEINKTRQTLLNLVLDILNQSIYRNPDFLVKKVSFKNYLNLNIEMDKELEADENGFWPLYQLLPFSLTLSTKLTVEILKRVKSLPLKLIKLIVKSIREDKISTEIYKNLDLLSQNQDMKKIFMEEFPEQRPLKLETFAKVIKYDFARVPYLKKLHEEALNCYTADYNEFLNQIFGIYSTEDIKQIEPILAKHKHIHFQVIKYLYSQNRMLEKEPMGLILKMPHLLDFETKKYLFRKHPKIRRVSRYRLPIEVSRDNILQESFNQIMSKTPKELEGRLQVTFMDEQGYDAGGLTRQWLFCLSRQIFNPNYGLFEPSSSGNTYQPNPKSYINPDHLQYFKFIGRLIGKALSENELVDAYFTRAFYKMVLGQQIELSDLEQQDYPFYKSMLWLKQNSIEEGDYTFSYLYDNFGQRIVKDLIPGGRDIKVNKQNKQQYIEKYCLAKMRDDFKVQIEKFLEGFHEIIPHECISFFEAKQLQLLISGLPEVNFNDLRNNVDYSGFSPTDPAIKWFWQILQEFTQQDLARLIQFITGTSKIPVDGFANIKGMNGPQRISIHKDPNVHQLPKAHTCFNQLDLPNYSTKQIMRERIVTAITWGSQGFGFM